jgi:hypothetical protein
MFTTTVKLLEHDEIKNGKENETKIHTRAILKINRAQMMVSSHMPFGFMFFNIHTISNTVHGRIGYMAHAYKQ